MVPISREPDTAGPLQSPETTTPWADILPHRLSSLSCHSVIIRAARREARTGRGGSNAFPFFLSILFGFFFKKRKGFQNPSPLEPLGNTVLHRAGTAAGDALLQLHHVRSREAMTALLSHPKIKPHTPSYLAGRRRDLHPILLYP